MSAPLGSRRHFLGATAVGAAVASSSWSQARATAAGEPFINKSDVILFQGDSITDAGRGRDARDPNLQKTLGNGYAWFASAGLLTERPGEGLLIHNRGISGNKVYQLAERWDQDCLAIKPNVLSILIGVNDFWHKKNGNYDGTIEIYERDSRALLERTRSALPHVKLIICEPFLLKCGAVNDSWFPDFDAYRAAARRVAESFEARFVPFQAMFDEAIKYAPPNHWAADGVHPSPAGASLMANAWLNAARA